MLRVAVAVGLSLSLLFPACTDPNPSIENGSGGEGTSSPVSGIVDCGGSIYEASAVADAPDASTLPAGPAGAVDDAGEPAFDPAQGWRVVQQSDDQVELLRELGEPISLGDGDVRTHESRILERITGSTNVPDGTWLLTSAGPCAQRLVDGSDDLSAADLTLARQPGPDATILELLVHERACASGQSAEGRIHLLEMTETDDQIRLRIAVRPRDGDQSCQGNPPTPLMIELARPVGQREIVDGSVVPARIVSLEAASEQSTAEQLDLAAMVQYGCGYGFWLGSSDDQVAVRFAAAHEPAAAGSLEQQVTLPNTDWEVAVLFGDHLYSNWCDDVVEPGEPEPIVREEWRVTAGTMTFLDMPPTAECGMARASLTDLVATRPGGTTIQLGDREVTNRDWGCFAG